MKKEVNKKFVGILCILFLIVGCVFSILIYSQYEGVDEVDITKLTSGNLDFYIDKVDDSSKDIIIIKGWALNKNENLQTVETYAMLKNTENNTYYKIPTTSEDRKDVTQNYNDGFNYDHSGFYSIAKKSKFKEKGKYEICILYLSDNHNEFVTTGKYVDIE